MSDTPPARHRGSRTPIACPAGDGGTPCVSRARQAVPPMGRDPPSLHRYGDEPAPRRALHARVPRRDSRVLHPTNRREQRRVPAAASATRRRGAGRGLRSRHDHRRPGPACGPGGRPGHVGGDGGVGPLAGDPGGSRQRHLRDRLGLRVALRGCHLRRGLRAPGAAASRRPGRRPHGVPPGAATRGLGGGPRLRLRHDDPRPRRAGHRTLARHRPSGPSGQRRRGRRREVPAGVGAPGRFRGTDGHDQQQHFRRPRNPGRLGRHVGGAGHRERLRRPRHRRRVRHPGRPGGDLHRLQALGGPTRRLLGVAQRRGRRQGSTRPTESTLSQPVTPDRDSPRLANPRTNRIHAQPTNNA